MPQGVAVRVRVRAYNIGKFFVVSPLRGDMAWQHVEREEAYTLPPGANLV